MQRMQQKLNRDYALHTDILRMHTFYVSLFETVHTNAMCALYIRILFICIYMLGVYMHRLYRYVKVYMGSNITQQFTNFRGL